MKEKISITLSSDLLAQVDRLAGSKLSRSAFIERVLRIYFRERTRKQIHARDLERINAAADRLNAEAEDILGYQSLEE
jgi:metal-responsive CopG/Arc/MetJ family transcriptional regulator